MFSRLVIFRDVHLKDADAALHWMQDQALPAARELEGFRAATALISRDTRTMAVLTFFESYETARSAEIAFAETATTMPAGLNEATEAWIQSAELMEVVIQEGF